MGLVASVCQPSILRMLIWPNASSTQNTMAALSGHVSAFRVLIRRCLNSSCSRSMAFVVRARRHLVGGNFLLLIFYFYRLLFSIATQIARWLLEFCSLHPWSQ